jgi:hypothetical protein
MKTLICALLTLFCLETSAAMFKYNELMIKDYDEMNKMVQSKVKQARAVGSNSSDENVNDTEAIEHLREALKLIYSRPNSDNMIAKLMPDVRRELQGYSAYEDSISGLTAEALEVIKNPKAATSQQATALFVLENILSEIRPEAGSNDDLRRVVERVKDAKIKVPNDVVKDLKLRGMYKTRNPSDTAADILKKLPKKEKKPEKKADEKPKDED